jgi:hypothetical protein
MKRTMVAAIAVAGALALPATSLGGRDDDGVHERGKLGQRVAKDSAKDNPAAAVARVTLDGYSNVSYRITGSPKDIKVDWGVTSRCVKGSLIDYWPGPGDFKTGTKKAGFKGKIPVPLADPDYCTFAVAAQTFKHDAGKRVTVALYKK